MRADDNAWEISGGSGNYILSTTYNIDQIHCPTPDNINAMLEKYGNKIQLDDVKIGGHSLKNTPYFYATICTTTGRATKLCTVGGPDLLPHQMGCSYNNGASLNITAASGLFQLKGENCNIKPPPTTGICSGGKYPPLDDSQCCDLSSSGDTTDSATITYTP